MRDFKINFMKNLPKYLGLSGALFAVVLIFTLVFGIQLDIQFRGGSIITYAYDGEMDMAAFESSLEGALGENVDIQHSTDATTGIETVVVSLAGNQSLNADELVSVTEKLQTDFPDNNVRSLEINNVNPTIGKEFLAKSLVVLAVALILVMLYVAFRFRRIGGLSAGAMGVVALVHDCIIVFGVFIICGIPINDNFIAVILTILGFSLNDTIVIYDRIRENKKLYGAKLPVGEMVSKSINQSLTRTINTSTTAVMAMIVVTVVALIYGVDYIISFSFPLLMGLISGTYSSLCLAGPLWVKWQEHKLKKKAAM